MAFPSTSTSRACVPTSPDLTSGEDWLEHYDKGLSTDFRAILLKSKRGETTGPQSQLPAWDFRDFRRTVYVERLPYFRDLMDQLQCPQGRMRILRLAPGCVIDLHRDVGGGGWVSRLRAGAPARADHHE